MFFALSIVKNLNITRVSRFFKSKTVFSVKQFEKNGSCGLYKASVFHSFFFSSAFFSVFMARSLDWAERMADRVAVSFA